MTILPSILASTEVCSPLDLLLIVGGVLLACYLFGQKPENP
ncbi:MAG: hypothetical protein PHE72_14620 [candidate division Zixibacteria bacterium]|nr:hypothetical protein [candidate division Zixibacteria bacterium]